MNKKKTNICFFIGSLQAGGAENHVWQLISNIDRGKYNPYLCVYRKKGQHLKDIEKSKIPIVEMRLSKTNPLSFLLIILKFYHFLKKYHIEIIHIHLVGCYVFGLVGAILAGVKLKIITWHNIYKFSKKKRAIHFGNKYSDIIVAVSDKVKKENCSLFAVRESNVKVVYNGISFLQFGWHKSYPSDNRFAIGAVGSLLPQKGFFYLINAFKNIVKDIPQAELIIAGEGPLRKEIEQLIKSKGIERQVRLLGNCDDIPMLLQRLDLWVMTSKFEGFSIALLEAMASKLPIIATNVGGNAEAVIHEESGIVIPPENVKAIEDAIKELYYNPEKRAFLAENAYMRFKNRFTVDIMMERLDEIYSG